ncbi:hypothetical protein [Oryzifoliimicrobium ureilyticus]|uniref:hypothetical protein n=1 Tax=Oryzifoliimicrobium ureilyticus TaxID=3113724 RepID=UPI003075F961
MSEDKNALHNDKKASALDVKTTALQAGVGEMNAQIEHGDDVGGDDLSKIETMREARRQHGDAFVVKSDLEDADQREATPGVREQD